MRHECEWCGVEHPPEALCPRGPRARGMSRRSFVFLGASAAVALALPVPAWPELAPPVIDLDGFGKMTAALFQGRIWYPPNAFVLPDEATSATWYILRDREIDWGKS